MSPRYRVSSLLFALFLSAMLLTVVSANAQTVFINEIHYDNNGADADEGVEIAGPAGTNLAGWKVRFYNGADGASYDVITLSGTIANQCNGIGTLWFPRVGLQNGSPDGLALMDNTLTIIQFLSYEGAFTATNFEANTLLSVDIGVSEAATAPVGTSLQLGGIGTVYGDFTWGPSAAHSRGSCNPGQEVPIPVATSTWGAIKALYR